MKTLEFKLSLTHQQEAICNEWLEAMRWVWNEGLGLLIEHEQYARQEFYLKALTQPNEKGIKQFRKNMGIPLETSYDVEGVKFRQIYLNKKGIGSNCKIAVGRGDDYFPCQPATLHKPRLKTANFLGLSGWMTKQRYPDVNAIKGVPATYLKGTLKNLAESWKAYKDKKRVDSHLPKFKSKRRGDKVKSLYTFQPETIKIQGNHIKLPGSKILGSLKVVNKGLSKRWGNIEPRTARICKRASGWYLQLTGEVEEKPLPKSDRCCGLDVGLQFIFTDDAGKTVNPPRYYRESEKRLRRLQRKLARQEKGSKNSEKTKAEIAKLHEKVANQRRNFNHKISTFTVRTFGGIVVEDIKLGNMNRKPKPVKNEDGKGYARNNASAKAGLNKSFADAGLGQLITMIESKAKDAEREFVKVNPAYTSQDCPECGHRQKKALSQRTHKCGNCGYTTPRDHAASQIIRKRGEETFSGSYRACSRKVKPVKDSNSGSVQQELS